MKQKGCTEVLKLRKKALMVLPQLPPRKIAPQIIVPWIIAPKKNSPPDNCPLTINFPSKIIAPTQANTSQ